MREEEINIENWGEPTTPKKQTEINVENWGEPIKKKNNEGVVEKDVYGNQEPEEIPRDFMSWQTNFSNLVQEYREKQNERIDNIADVDDSDTPETSFGSRVDGTAKSSGFLGELQMQDGSDKIATELSVGVEFDDYIGEIPTLVPTLSQEEVDYLLKGNEPTDAIVDKAIAHARKEISEGRNPFGEESEPPKPTDFLNRVNRENPHVIPVLTGQRNPHPMGSKNHLEYNQLEVGRDFTRESMREFSEHTGRPELEYFAWQEFYKEKTNNYEINPSDDDVNKWLEEYLADTRVRTDHKGGLQGVIESTKVFFDIAQQNTILGVGADVIYSTMFLTPDGEYNPMENFRSLRQSRASQLEKYELTLQQRAAAGAGSILTDAPVFMGAGKVADYTTRAIAKPISDAFGKTTLAMQNFNMFRAGVASRVPAKTAQYAANGATKTGLQTLVEGTKVAGEFVRGATTHGTTLGLYTGVLDVANQLSYMSIDDYMSQGYKTTLDNAGMSFMMGTLAGGVGGATNLFINRWQRNIINNAKIGDAPILLPRELINRQNFLHEKSWLKYISGNYLKFFGTPAIEAGIFTAGHTGIENITFDDWLETYTMFALLRAPQANNAYFGFGRRKPMPTDKRWKYPNNPTFNQYELNVMNVRTQRQAQAKVNDVGVQNLQKIYPDIPLVTIQKAALGQTGMTPNISHNIQNIDVRPIQVDGAEKHLVEYKDDKGRVVGADVYENRTDAFSIAEKANYELREHQLYEKIQNLTPEQITEINRTTNIDKDKLWEAQNVLPELRNTEQNAIISQFEQSIDNAVSKYPKPEIVPKTEDKAVEVAQEGQVEVKPETVTQEAETVPDVAKQDALKDVESTAKALEGIDIAKIEDVIVDRSRKLDKSYEDDSFNTYVKQYSENDWLNKASQITFKKNYSELDSKQKETIDLQKKQYWEGEGFYGDLDAFYGTTDRDARLTFHDVESNNPRSLSEAYHAAKADGSNPQLVEAVESLLGKAETVKPDVAKPTEVKPETTTKEPPTPPTEAKPPPTETKPPKPLEVVKEYKNMEELQKELKVLQDMGAKAEAGRVESFIADVRKMLSEMPTEILPTNDVSRILGKAERAMKKVKPETRLKHMDKALKEIQSIIDKNVGKFAKKQLSQAYKDFESILDVSRARDGRLVGKSTLDHNDAVKFANEVLRNRNKYETKEDAVQAEYEAYQDLVSEYENYVNEGNLESAQDLSNKIAGFQIAKTYAKILELQTQYDNATTGMDKLFFANEIQKEIESSNLKQWGKEERAKFRDRLKKISEANSKRNNEIRKSLHTKPNLEQSVDKVAQHLDGEKFEYSETVTIEDKKYRVERSFGDRKPTVTEISADTGVDAIIRGKSAKKVIEKLREQKPNFDKQDISLPKALNELEKSVADELYMTKDQRNKVRAKIKAIRDKGLENMTPSQQLSKIKKALGLKKNYTQSTYKTVNKNLNFWNRMTVNFENVKGLIDRMFENKPEVYKTYFKDFIDSFDRAYDNYDAVVAPLERLIAKMDKTMDKKFGSFEKQTEEYGLKTIAKDAKGRTIDDFNELSPADIFYIQMLTRSEESVIKLRANYSEKTIEDLITHVNEIWANNKEVFGEVESMVKELTDNVYEIVNKEYRRFYHTDLPKHADYIQTFAHNIESNIELDNNVNIRSKTPGSIRQRTQHLRGLRLQVPLMKSLTNYTNDMVAWASHNPVVQQYNAVFGNPEIQTAIKQNIIHGDKILRSLNKIMQNYPNPVRTDSGFGAFRNLIIARLLVNPSLPFKQFASATNGILAYREVLGETTANDMNTIFGELQYFYEFGRGVGNGDFVEYIQAMIKNPSVRRRMFGSEIDPHFFESQNSALLIDLIEHLGRSKDWSKLSAMKQWRRLNSAFKKIEGMPIKVGDVGAFIGYMPVYAQHKRAILQENPNTSKEEAMRLASEKTYAIGSRTQQSTRSHNMCSFQYSFAKNLFPYMTTPIQYGQQYRKGWRRLTKPGYTKTERFNGLKDMFYYGVVQPYIFKLVGSATFKWFSSSDEDLDYRMIPDKDANRLEWLALSLMGATSGVPLLDPAVRYVGGLTHFKGTSLPAAAVFDRRVEDFYRIYDIVNSVDGDWSKMSEGQRAAVDRSITNLSLGIGEVLTGHGVENWRKVIKWMLYENEHFYYYQKPKEKEKKEVGFQP